MRAAIFLLMLCMSPLLFGSEQDANREESTNKRSVQKDTVSVDGQTIDYINIAFSDYLKHEPNLKLRAMKYYTFAITEEEQDVIYIDIQYNTAVMREEPNREMVGGGGGYYIDKKRGAIESRFFYK